MTTNGRPETGGKQFAIIGGGTMGEAFTRALLANNLASASAICVCEINASRRQKLQDQLGVQGTDSASVAAESAPVVVLAVKPQDFATIGGALQGLVLPEQLVLSIMAGVSISTLRDTLGHRALVRAMPQHAGADWGGLHRLDGIGGGHGSATDAVAPDAGDDGHGSPGAG